MTHRFPIKEIARQTGLGTATIDRVLNNRANVSPQTRARVAAALKELEAQESQLSARGRRLFVDIVVEAPKRFSSEIKKACEEILPTLPYGVFRPRFHLQEVMTDAEILATLTRIKKRGSQGICLKARVIPQVQSMVNDCVASGIPVATLVTDIPQSNRTAYCGIDNRKAGASAAYLLANVMGTRHATILTSRSQLDFQGEADRLQHFKSTLLGLRPEAQILELIGGAGLETETKRQLDAQRPSLTHLDAVYSMGGGNRGILDYLKHHGLTPNHFVAHDLDADNLSLLQTGQISFVLHHDLAEDMRRALGAIAAHHRLIRDPLTGQPSDVQIITPFNIPAQLITAGP